MSNWSFDMYTKYDSEAEMVEARKEEIMDACMENRAYWVSFRELMLSDSRKIAAILDILRDMSKYPHRDTSEYHARMVQVIRLFDDAVEEVADKRYQYLDMVLPSTLKE